MPKSFGIAAGPVRARRSSGADAPGDLGRLLVDLDLSEADAAQRPALRVVLVDPGRHHVYGRPCARGVEAAADRLSIDQVVLADGGLRDRVDPHPEGLLELFGVERREDAAEGVAAQRPAFGWLGMPLGRSRSDPNHSMLELPKSSISVQRSAPQMIEQSAMTRMPGPSGPDCGPAPKRRVVKLVVAPALDARIADKMETLPDGLAHGRSPIDQNPRYGVFRPNPAPNGGLMR